MKVNPHLSFNGQCETAFKFYEEVLGGKVTFSMTWGEMPGADQFPPESHKLIMHTALSVGDETLMGADAPPGPLRGAERHLRGASSEESCRR
jgi:PhnB protein